MKNGTNAYDVLILGHQEYITQQWVGSNYLCYQCVTRFAYDPFRYTAHKEQYVTNRNDIILLDYNASLPSSL